MEITLLDEISYDVFLEKICSKCIFWINGRTCPYEGKEEKCKKIEIGIKKLNMYNSG